MKQPIVNPYIAVIFGVAAVSFSSLFVKMSHAHSFIIAFYRLFLTFLILFPLQFKSKFNEIKQTSIKNVILASASGICLAFHFITWFVSLKYTSVASSVVLVTTQPIWVVLVSYLLFSEKICNKALLGGAIALVGSIMIGASDFKVGGNALLGDILALIGALAVSGYLIIGRFLRAELSLPLYTTVTYGSSSLAIGLVAFISGQKFYPYSLKEWALFFALAFICTVMGHTVFNWALKYVSASVVAIGVLGEPVGAIIWTWLFLGEKAGERQLLSAAVILLGLYLFTKTSGEMKITEQEKFTDCNN